MSILDWGGGTGEIGMAGGWVPGKAPAASDVLLAHAGSLVAVFDDLPGNNITLDLGSLSQQQPATLFSFRSGINLDTDWIPGTADPGYHTGMPWYSAVSEVGGYDVLNVYSSETLVGSHSTISIADGTYLFYGQNTAAGNIVIQGTGTLVGNQVKMSQTDETVSSHVVSGQFSERNFSHLEFIGGVDQSASVDVSSGSSLTAQFVHGNDQIFKASITSADFTDQTTITLLGRAWNGAQYDGNTLTLLDNSTGQQMSIGMHLQRSDGSLAQVGFYAVGAGSSNGGGAPGIVIATQPPPDLTRIG